MVESPWQARQSSLVGFGAGLRVAPAAATANTRQRTPYCRSWIPGTLRQKSPGNAGIAQPPPKPQPTSALLLGRMGRGAVSLLTPRRDCCHTGMFAAGLVFAPSLTCRRFGIGPLRA